jgi:peptidoglycan hydrolase CwlO-like protein
MATSKFIITTTGSLSVVPLAGLGKIPGYSHPATADLLEEFDLQEIQDPNSDVQAAIDAGYIIATNETGAIVTNILNDTTPSLIKDNLSASVDPTASVDSTSGYSVGSTWINGNNVFVCTDNTSGVALWQSTTDSGASPSVSADITFLSGAIDDNTTNITTISGDVTNLGNDVTYLSGEIDNNSNEINYLSGEIDGLSGDFVTLATDQTITGDKIFTGDVTVDGVFTATSAVFITTENLGLSSNYVTLNTNETGNPTQDAGIAVERGTSANALVNWNETEDQWEIGISGDTLLRILDESDLSGLSGLPGDITNIENDITTISGDVINLSSEVNYISGEVSDLLLDITALSAAIDANDIDITFLSGAIDDNSTNISTLSSTLGTLSAGSYILGNDVANDLVLLDSAVDTISSDLADARIFTFSAARNSNNSTNIYLRGPNGTPTNQAGFVLPYAAKLIAITTATNGNATWVGEVRKNGAVGVEASITVTASDSDVSNVLSVPFAEGDEVQLYCNGTNINRPHMMVYFVRT